MTSKTGGRPPQTSSDSTDSGAVAGRDAPLVGRSLAPYDVAAFLGSGGMGTVYRARDRRLGRAVAIKVLPGHLVHDPHRLRRFEQEARAAGTLNHANILSVYDVGTDSGTPYIVFELLEGDTLRKRLMSGGI